MKLHQTLDGQTDRQDLCSDNSRMFRVYFWEHNEEYEKEEKKEIRIKQERYR